MYYYCVYCNSKYTNNYLTWVSGFFGGGGEKKKGGREGEKIIPLSSPWASLFLSFLKAGYSG